VLQKKKIFRGIFLSGKKTIKTKQKLTERGGKGDLKNSQEMEPLKFLLLYLDSNCPI
jgi:hypothetical protein